MSTIVAAVTADQLPLPTTCPAWNVRTVINHIALGALRVAAWTERRPAPGWDTDYLGPDFHRDFTAAIASARNALTAPGALDRQVAAAFGPAAVPTLVTMLVNEFLAHGWDVAIGTGQRTEIDPELAELSLADARLRFAGLPRSNGGPFAQEVAAPTDATAADRLAAFLGRSATPCTARPVDPCSAAVRLRRTKARTKKPPWPGRPSLPGETRGS